MLRVGIEPTRENVPADFKSAAFASFATGARSAIYRLDRHALPAHAGRGTGAPHLRGAAEPILEVASHFREYPRLPLRRRQHHDRSAPAGAGKPGAVGASLH